MSNFTILSSKQTNYDKQLDIFKIRGVQAEITDFAILCGAYYNEYGKGCYWTSSYAGMEDVQFITGEGKVGQSEVVERAIRSTCCFTNR